MSTATPVRDTTTETTAATSSSSTATSNMKVVVRVRPVSHKETAAGRKSCVETLDDSRHVVIRKAGSSSAYLKSQTTDAINEFAFDHVLHAQSSQQDVYNHTIRAYLDRIVEGQHVTVFAYGATGSGKTHTMFGNDFTTITAAGEGDSNSSNKLLKGLIPNTIEDLFHKIQEERQRCALGEAWSLSFSFFEVYNDQVFDLLDTNNTSSFNHAKTLPLREDAEKGIVQIVGLTEHSIESCKQMMELLHKGQKCRKMEPTMANVVSSRSHAIIQITLRHITRTSAGFEKLIESKLSLIDLAGSERASATNNRGVRLQEGANINKSLLALAYCINALSEMHSQGSSKKTTNAVIKYRDSKLTHLLKSSLEGHCNLIMIANVNPCDNSYEDSLHTLMYANRAKNIKVNPSVKERILESTSLEREARLKEENEILRQRIVQLEAENAVLQQNNVELQQALEQQQEVNAKKGRKSSALFSLGGSATKSKDHRRSSMAMANKALGDISEYSPNKSPKVSLSSSPNTRLSHGQATSSPLNHIVEEGGEEMNATDAQDVEVDLQDNEQEVENEENHLPVIQLPKDEVIKMEPSHGRKAKGKRSIWTMFGCGTADI